jgi:pilus assembly protein Flp/PilA
MTHFIASAKKFIKSEDAPTMVEYGLLFSLIALIVASAVSILGSNTKGIFTTVGRSI